MGSHLAAIQAKPRQEGVHGGRVVGAHNADGVARLVRAIRWQRKADR